MGYDQQVLVALGQRTLEEVLDLPGRLGRHDHDLALDVPAHDVLHGEDVVQEDHVVSALVRLSILGLATQREVHRFLGDGESDVAEEEVKVDRVGLLEVRVVDHAQGAVVEVGAGQLLDQLGQARAPVGQGLGGTEGVLAQEGRLLGEDSVREEQQVQ